MWLGVGGVQRMRDVCAVRGVRCSEDKRCVR